MSWYDKWHNKEKYDKAAKMQEFNIAAGYSVPYDAYKMAKGPVTSVRILACWAVLLCILKYVAAHVYLMFIVGVLKSVPNLLEHDFVVSWIVCWSCAESVNLFAAVLSCCVMMMCLGQHGASMTWLFYNGVLPWLTEPRAFSWSMWSMTTSNFAMAVYYGSFYHWSKMFKHLAYAAAYFIIWPFVGPVWYTAEGMYKIMGLGGISNAKVE